MAIKEIVDENGRKRYEVSKYWPGNSGRFRRFFPNKTAAQKTFDRIAGAIAGGTWRELKEQLDRTIEEQPEVFTLESFTEGFIEHCKSVGHRSWKRYELSLSTINTRLGKIELPEFRRYHLHDYVEKRSKDESLRNPGQKVAPNTINNEITALASMFSYALEKGVIDAHPLVRFKKLRLQEQEIRVPSQAEYETLITKAAELDQVVAGYLVTLGELGLRKKEGLQMCRHWINWQNSTATISGLTKSRKIRTVPLTDTAITWLKAVLAVVPIKDNHVFYNSNTGRAWEEPKKIFYEAREAAGLPWIGLHTLRHFRVSRWFAEGHDPRTIQVWAGHSDIKTTMRYCHFAPDPTRVQRQVQEA
jgi:integrase